MPRRTHEVVEPYRQELRKILQKLKVIISEQKYSRKGHFITSEG